MSLRYQENRNGDLHHNLFIFRIHFYFDFGTGSNDFRSPPSNPRHKKEGFQQTVQIC